MRLCVMHYASIRADSFSVNCSGISLQHSGIQSIADCVVRAYWKKSVSEPMHFRPVLFKGPKEFRLPLHLLLIISRNFLTVFFFFWLLKIYFFNWSITASQCQFLIYSCTTTGISHVQTHTPRLFVGKVSALTGSYHHGQERNRVNQQQC